MTKKSVLTKRSSYVVGSLLFVTLCVTGGIIYNSATSSKVVLKDQMQIHRKMLHNGAGEHACDCFAPQLTGFEIKNVTATSAEISWYADVPSSFQVRWGRDNAWENTYPEEMPGDAYTENTVLLEGLEPETTYKVGPLSICQSNCYRNDYYGLQKTNADWQDEWEFTTEPANAVVENSKASSETALTTISEVAVAKVTASDVTITWKTNAPATSYLEYGLTTAYGIKCAESKILQRNHKRQLFDLQNGKTYHARAVSKDASGVTLATSADFTFTTPAFEDRIANKLSIISEPNPCSDRAMFVYQLYQPVKSMTVDILTLSGKTVATLESPASCLSVGYNRLLWDVKDNKQKQLGNGLYVYKMTFYTDNNQMVATGNLAVKR